MNPSTLHLRTATADDLDTLLQWREDAASWLRSEHDTAQWSAPEDPQRVHDWIEQGATFVASLQPGSPPVATITSTPHGDPVLWTADELRTPARYLHRLVVARSHAGMGIGACLGLWARSHAARMGFSIVRYSAWATNEKLIGFYRGLQGRHVRTVPGIRCGALFEDPVQPRDDLPVVEDHVLI